MRKFTIALAILFANSYAMPLVNVASADTNLPITLAQYYGGDNSYDYHPHHEYHQQYHQNCHRVCTSQDYYGHCTHYRSYCD